MSHTDDSFGVSAPSFSTLLRCNVQKGQKSLVSAISRYVLLPQVPLYGFADEVSDHLVGGATMGIHTDRAGSFGVGWHGHHHHHRPVGDCERTEVHLDNTLTDSWAIGRTQTQITRR